MTSHPPHLTGITRDALAELLGEPERPSTTRAHAFLRHLWRPGGDLSSLPARVPGVTPKALERLTSAASMPRLTEVARRTALDGTLKLLLDADGAPLETVMIPGRGRVTVCVSSQSGCSRDCTFCATAKMGFRRNLSAGEIVAQVLLARAVAPEGLPVRNVVFMGMGEPLDNLDEVVRAVEVLSTPGGLGLSPQHITVSTSGVLPRMEAFVQRSPACLALSLNGTTEAQRQAVMPIEKIWKLSSLLAFMRTHSGSRLFFVEYILMGGLNDALEDAERLCDLLEGIQARVNLIPFNPHPGAPFRRPEPEAVQAFFAHVNGRGLRALVRMPRGDEIAAACGQLQREVLSC